MLASAAYPGGASDQEHPRFGAEVVMGTRCLYRTCASAAPYWLDRAFFARLGAHQADVALVCAMHWEFGAVCSQQLAPDEWYRRFRTRSRLYGARATPRLALTAIAVSLADIKAADPFWTCATRRPNLGSIITSRRPEPNPRTR